MIEFDGKNRLIKLDDRDILDIRELYYIWREWLSNERNLKYPLAMRYVGGDKIDDTRLGITYFLINGWKIKPFSKDYTLKVNGNIYSDDNKGVFVPADGDVNVMVVNKVSNLIDIVPLNVYNNITTSSQSVQQTQSVGTVYDNDGDWTLTQ